MTSCSCPDQIQVATGGSRNSVQGHYLFSHGLENIFPHKIIKKTPATNNLGIKSHILHEHHIDNRFNNMNIEQKNVYIIMEYS